MEILKRAWSWVVVSSADPKRWSMTIKGLLAMFVPILASLAGLDTDTLNGLVQTIAQTVEYGLYFVGALVALYGLVRKLYNTVTM